jgi:hypothetical protein
MAEQSTAIQKAQPAPSAIQSLAEGLGIKQSYMLEVVKAQCFKGVDPNRITDQQLAAYVSSASAIRAVCPTFNPLLTGMLYAYPSKNGGVECMIGPDGVFALLSTHPGYKNYDWHPEYDANGKIFAGTVVINMKDGTGPFKKRCVLSEWHIQSNPNWNTRPEHMLEIRTLKQAARQIIHGIPFDEDERAIAQAVEVQYEDVTGRQPTGTRTEQLREALTAPRPAPRAEEPIEDAETGPAPSVDDYLPAEPTPEVVTDPTGPDQDEAKVEHLTDLINTCIELTNAPEGEPSGTVEYWCEYYSSFEGKKGVKTPRAFLAAKGKNEKRHAAAMELLDKTIARAAEALEET